MSAKVKKAGRIGTKIVAAFLFVFLVMFNVQIGMHDGESADISLFGLKLSLFTPTYASTGETNGRLFVDPEDGWNHCLCPWVPKNCSPCY